jgi:large subunit ribosomal protein L4
MKVTSYSIKGIKGEKADLPLNLSSEVNMTLLAQAVRVYENHQHTYLAKTKTRSYVDLTTKKVYKQKGTGGARHGDKAAPIFVGGGTAHGPKGIQKALIMPEKMRKNALMNALSLKVKEGKVLVVEGFNTLKKTKDAQNLVTKVLKEEKLTGKSNLMVILSPENKDKAIYLRNLKRVVVLPQMGLNAYNVFYCTAMLFDNALFTKETKAALTAKKTTQEDKNEKTTKTTKKTERKTKK